MVRVHMAESLALVGVDEFPIVPVSPLPSYALSDLSTIFRSYLQSLVLFLVSHAFEIAFHLYLLSVVPVSVLEVPAMTLQRMTVQMVLRVILPLASSSA